MPQPSASPAPRNILLSSASAEGAAPIREAADRLCRQATRKALLTAAGIGAGMIVPNRQDGPLDALLGRVEEGGVVFLVEHEGRACGLISLSKELSHAVTEAQTLGRPSEEGPVERELTSVDEIFARPVALVFVGALAEEESALSLWAGGAEIGERLETLALGGLVLPAGRYRLLRLEVAVGENRSGEIALLLPQEGVQASAAREARRHGLDLASAENWRLSLERNVLEARVELSVILHKMSLTLGEIEDFAVGQMLYLQSAKLDGVMLCGVGGQVVAEGCLGKIGGARALRIGVSGPQALDEGGPDLLMPQRPASASRRGVIPPMS